MKKYLTFLYVALFATLSFTFTSCDGEAKVKTSEDFKTENASWGRYTDNGVTCTHIGSQNYKVIEGHPIAMGVSVYDVPAKHTGVFALNLWDAGVTESQLTYNFDTSTKVIITVDGKTTTFDKVEGVDKSELVITSGREALEWLDNLLDAEKFTVTVTLQGDKEFTFEFKPNASTPNDNTPSVSPSKSKATVDWYNQQSGWFKNQKGNLMLFSDNVHSIDGRQIALAFDVVNAGAGRYFAALILTDVSKNVDNEGERCPSLANYPRVSMTFDGEPVEWTTERPVGSAVTLCNDNDANELVDKLVKTHNFTATVRLADGTNLEFKFSPYHQK